MGITRSKFLVEKRKSIGYKGMEKLYGCPYWALLAWARFHTEITFSRILTIEAMRGYTTPELKEMVEIANVGIRKINAEWIRDAAK